MYNEDEYKELSDTQEIYAQKLEEMQPSSEGGERGCLYTFLGIFLALFACATWQFFTITGYLPQSKGQIVIENLAEVSLDETAIETAAQSLRENFGINLAIYIVDEGNHSDFLSRLRANGLMQNFEELRSNTYAIYIGVDNQYSEIGWSANLARVDGDQLRREVLNPRLNERDYTGALLNTYNLSVERLRDGNLAFQELGRMASEWSDEGLIIGIILFVIFFAVYAQSQGWYEGNYSGSSSSWRSSSSSSSHSSSSGSSSSPKSGGGGFSGGSWKD